MKEHKIGIVILVLFFNLCLAFTNSVAYGAPIPVAIENNDLPFSISYPSSWYICKESYGNTQSYFITREQIRTPTDQFLVGITVIFLKDKLLGLDWNNVKNNQISAYKSQGLEMNDINISTISGYSAFAFLIRGSRSKMFIAYVKKGNDLINVIQESPSPEWDNYEGSFKDNLSTLYFK